MRIYPEHKINLQFISKASCILLLVIATLSASAQTTPEAVNDTVRMCVGTTTTINVLDNDEDPDAGEILETDVLFGPTSGLIDYEDGAVEGDYIITVDPEFVGEDAIIYEVCGEDDLCDIAVIVIIVLGPDGCVWPGDANGDSISNHIDLLAIGVYYGSTGPARLDDDGTWEESFSDDWDDLIGSDIANNPKFIDCNGDGIIDANDTLIIVNNYGQQHGEYLPEAFIGGADDPLLTLDFFTDSIESGTEVVIPLKLGTDATPATNIYGLAFQLDYDETLIVPGSIRVTFNSGWLGIPGTDLLSLSANDEVNGRLDASVTRINQLAISGSGNIGEVSFVMEDNIAGKISGIYTSVLKFCIEQPTMINESGEIIPVQIDCDSVIAYQFTDAIQSFDEADLIISPNPAGDWIQIQIPQEFNGTVQLMNMFGQTVLEQIATEGIAMFNTHNLTSGTYIIMLTNEKTIIQQKVIIQH